MDRPEGSRGQQGVLAPKGWDSGGGGLGASGFDPHPGPRVLMPVRAFRGPLVGEGSARGRDEAQKCRLYPKADLLTLYLVGEFWPPEPLPVLI